MNVPPSPVFAGLLSPLVIAGPVVRGGGDLAVGVCFRQLS